MEECARLVRGVSWNGTAGNWQVALSHEGQGRTRESFPADKEKEAAECYDAEARGAEAKLNFPRDDGWAWLFATSVALSLMVSPRRW